MSWVGRWDFFNFLLTCFGKGFIQNGDFVIFDNASVHSSDSMMILDEFFSALGIHLIRTPTYSPELNGIEKLFGFLKDKIYHGECRNRPIKDFLIEQIPLVSQRNIIEWMRSSILF